MRPEFPTAGGEQIQRGQSSPGKVLRVPSTQQAGPRSVTLLRSCQQCPDSWHMELRSAPEPLLRCPQPNTLAITSPSKQPDPDKGVWDSDCPKQGNMAQKDYMPALTGTTCNSWAPPDLSFPASLSLQTGCWHFPEHECRSRECQTGTGLGQKGAFIQQQ